MKLRTLRPLRRVVSLVLLLLLSALFLDPWNLVPDFLRDTLTSFQLLPALVKSLVGLGLWSAGVLAVLLVTLLFGRVYCSSLCPLGTLQDLIIALAPRRRRHFRYQRPPYRLHTAVLITTAGTFLLGHLALTEILEPFSIYGRLVHGLARPMLFGIVNGLAFGLASVGHYAVDPLPLAVDIGALLLGSVPLIALVGYLAWTRGRFFCNSLCPAGALLRLLARYSLLRIVFDPARCKDCGLCEKVCKASCIESAARRVDFQACVSCFNCLHVCPTAGLTYARTRSSVGKNGSAGSPGRRKLLVGSMAVLLGSQTRPADSLMRRPAVIRPHPITPPGSRGVEHFTARCTACHLCVSLCPTQVLRPGVLDYGIAGIFQPKMDYAEAYCLYECTVCTTVCPSGAILPVTLEEKKRLQLGRVRFLKDECIVITKKTDCGACAEHCPTKAVRMVPHESLRLPETNDEICVGCGACEKACPTKPQKAIYVEALSAHGRAKEPPQEKPQMESEPLQEFPF